MMSSYRGTARGPDKVKAIGAVVAVHVALAFIILAGLNVRMVGQAVERLTTIAIRETPPPPPTIAPRPAPKPQPLPKPEGAPARKAEPTPIVAPPNKFPTPSPIPAAKVAGTGAAITAGNALAGTGTGSGEAGTGAGGGGDTSRFTPARLVSNIPNFEYRALAATGIPSGLVGVIVLVNPDGRLSNCRIAQSSGDPSIDSLVCQLTERFVHFDPARDPYGRPVAQDVTYFPNWRRR